MYRAPGMRTARRVASRHFDRDAAVRRTKIESAASPLVALELHVEGEESELFPALEQALGEARLLELGLAMSAEARERGAPVDGEVSPGLDPSA